MSTKHHESVFNYALGALLQTLRRGWRDRVKTEKTGSIVGGDIPPGRADNLIYADEMQPVAVEAAFAGTADIDRDAIARLGREDGENRREIMTAVAVAIPQSVKNIKGGVAEVQKWLQDGGELEYAVYSLVRGESGEIPEKGYDVRYPDGERNSGYIRGAAADLADLIELAATPDKKIKQVAQAAGGRVIGDAALMHKLLPAKLRQQIARDVGQPPDEHAMRVAVCIWLNALTLHDKLSAALPDKIAAPYSCRNWRQTAAAWKTILTINYQSVFRPALASLEMLSARGDLASGILSSLREHAHNINELRLGYAADVASDMFQKLATDRKTTAAFYTRMEVAELLAGLAFNLIPNDGRDLKIADFACGTGALLKAAYRQVRRRAEPKKTDMDNLHKKYMEDCLHGADIQPIAAHLTAAGLAGMHPSAAYAHSNIICADVRRGKTGALNLLKFESITDLFGASSAFGADKSKTEAFRSADNTFDLCIMNPPYTSYHGGMKLFDVRGVKETERELSKANLNRMLRNSFANTKAGLASAFCLLGDRKLKAGGVLASVLPASAAGQGSWRKFRAHMLSRYSEVTVVGLVPGSGKSFSADTGMEEMLFLGKKNGAKGGVLTVINLYRVPRDFIEAHEIARVVRGIKTRGELKVGEHVFGVCVKSRPQNGESWGAVGGKSADTGIVAENLAAGNLLYDGRVRKISINPPMKSLGSHLRVGPSHNQIGHLPGRGAIGAFVFRPARSGDKVNMSLWEANYRTQLRLLCEPSQCGELMEGREELAQRMLDMRSTLFISRNLRITSQTLAAAMTAEPCMGGSAWTALGCAETTRAAYCLWFNSLPGLIVRWYCSGRQHPGRARMQINDIKQFPCPNFSAKNAAAKRAVKIANEKFARLAALDLMPCSYAWRDDARKEIDRVVLRMLGLDKKVSEDSMQALREEWCREPSVHGGNQAIRKTLQADDLL